MLAAIGNRVLELDPGMEVTYLAGESFIAELIEAIEQNQVEGWRARYRRSKVFLLENVSALADTERAQDELFHLFDELQRSGAQLIFTGEAEPEQLTGLADRLRTRLGSGLVITLPTMHSGSAREGEGAPLSVVDRSDPWFLDPEKVVTEWPYPEGLIVEDWS